MRRAFLLTFKIPHKYYCTCLQAFYIHPWGIAFPISSPVLFRLLLCSIFLLWVSTVCLGIFKMAPISLLAFPSVKNRYPLREPLIVLAKPSMHLCRYGEQKYISSADHAVSHRSLQSKLHNSESLLPAA